MCGFARQLIQWKKEVVTSLLENARRSKWLRCLGWGGEMRKGSVSQPDLLAGFLGVVEL